MFGYVLPNANRSLTSCARKLYVTYSNLGFFAENRQLVQLLPLREPLFLPCLLHSHLIECQLVEQIILAKQISSDKIFLLQHQPKLATVKDKQTISFFFFLVMHEFVFIFISFHHHFDKPTNY